MNYAYEMLKQFHPRKINDMSIVNAALRPSGASYRNRLLSGEINKNPSSLIDDLLKDNNGYLIFQEDTIKFLQQICGLSGSEADNIRRAIGRKQVDRLEKSLPKILNGYCKMSPQPKEIAEEEAKQFLKIIEDSARYQFGFNHSTGYSMIGYLCAYLRYYYPEEFIAAYLNCANNSDDIVYGTDLARLKNVKILPIKFGKSGADYSVDKQNHSVYKGIESIKYCNAQIAEELYNLVHDDNYHFDNFIQLLTAIREHTSVRANQLEILIKLNFFSDFGNNKYLMAVSQIYDNLMNIKVLNKDKIESLGIPEFIIKKYAGKETKKQYRDLDNVGIIKELVKKLENKPFGIIEQMKFEQEYLGYIDYTNTSVSNNYYVIIDFKQYKDTTKPHFIARKIYDGTEISSRIKLGKIYKNNPFGKWSVLRINSFTKEFKKAPNADGKWVSTNELEDILEDYEVIKN